MEEFDLESAMQEVEMDSFGQELVQILEARHNMAHLESAAKAQEALVHALQAAGEDFLAEYAEKMRSPIETELLEEAERAHPGPWLVWFHRGRSLFAGPGGGETDAAEPDKAHEFSDFEDAMRAFALNGAEGSARIMHRDREGKLRTVWPRPGARQAEPGPDAARVVLDEIKQLWKQGPEPQDYEDIKALIRRVLKEQRSGA